ncbi:LIC_10190 family membrane protein [Winogradskyella ursingii]|uniref:LIC_10190 family membrane protein n=1 Tax=Winogradskyella ursingii TaxID=2686079 RepID=UPI0015C914B0|nr:hypothetical protein [Winogradskyella ursingii]
MLLILLSLIYVFFTSLNFGLLFSKLFGVKAQSNIIIILLGLFSYTILCCVVAFFYRLNLEFYVIILITNILLAFKFKTDLRIIIFSLDKTYKDLKVKYKWLFATLVLLLLAQSSTRPYLIDNESYYIQTIKWINEYGYVKGLANLHVFFGQNSAFHTLQAGLNFSFFGDNFNDLNGFIFMVLGFLSIVKLNQSKQNTDNLSYYFGLILLFSVFLFQFVNAPSPDLIIFLLTPYIFLLFIKHYHSISHNDFFILLSLVLFLCLIKVTVLVLVLLVMILFIKHFKILKFHFLRYTILCVMVLGIYLYKNYVISGYLFFPNGALYITSVDWKLPEEILSFYQSGTRLAGFYNTDISHLSLIDKIQYWLTLPKLHGFFNKLFVLLLLLFPFFIYKRKEKNALWIIYVLGIFQLMIVWFNSPQYRFYFVFVIFFSTFIFSSIVTSRKIGFGFVITSMLASGYFLFFQSKAESYTNNRFAMELSNFKFQNLLYPEGNSKTNTVFHTANCNGFEYNSPDNDTFFYSTGNGPLPCVNQQQIDYFETYFGYCPELRGESLKEGFKSVKSDGN